MKALEINGQIDEQGQLHLIEPLPQPLDSSKQVRVIILYPDEEYGTEEPYDTPIEEVKASLKRALQEVDAGETISLAELWEEFEQD